LAHREYHFSESADELAALLNGAAQQQPRMVELQLANAERRPLLIAPGDVSTIVQMGDYNLTGKPEPDRDVVPTCYVTMKTDETFCVIGAYQDIKRLLFGDAPAAAKDGE